MYSGYGITFDGGGSWSFDNDTARNVIISGVDSSSSSHADNLKNNFLVLGLGPLYGVNGKISINFTNQIQHFTWVYIIMMIIVIYLLMEK